MNMQQSVMWRKFKLKFNVIYYKIITEIYASVTDAFLPLYVHANMKFAKLIYIGLICAVA